MAEDDLYGTPRDHQEWAGPHQAPGVGYRGDHRAGPPPAAAHAARYHGDDGHYPSPAYQHAPSHQHMYRNTPHGAAPAIGHRPADYLLHRPSPAGPAAPGATGRGFADHHARQIPSPALLQTFISDNTAVGGGPITSPRKEGRGTDPIASMPSQHSTLCDVDLYSSGAPDDCPAVEQGPPKGHAGGYANFAGSHADYQGVHSSYPEHQHWPSRGIPQRSQPQFTGQYAALDGRGGFPQFGGGANTSGMSRSYTNERMEPRAAWMRPEPHNVYERGPADGTRPGSTSPPNRGIDMPRHGVSPTRHTDTDGSSAAVTQGPSDALEQRRIMLDGQEVDIRHQREKLKTDKEHFEGQQKDLARRLEQLNTSEADLSRRWQELEDWETDLKTKTAKQEEGLVARQNLLKDKDRLSKEIDIKKHAMSELEKDEQRMRNQNRSLADEVAEKTTVIRALEQTIARLKAEQKSLEQGTSPGRTAELLGPASHGNMAYPSPPGPHPAPTAIPKTPQVTSVPVSSAPQPVASVASSPPGVATTADRESSSETQQLSAPQGQRPHRAGQDTIVAGQWNALENIQADKDSEAVARQLHEQLAVEQQQQDAAVAETVARQDHEEQQRKAREKEEMEREDFRLAQALAEVEHSDEAQIRQLTEIARHRLSAEQKSSAQAAAAAAAAQPVTTPTQQPAATPAAEPFGNTTSATSGLQVASQHGGIEEIHRQLQMQSRT